MPGTIMTHYIKEKKIVIFGFGTQGRAQAQNLQDNGLDVTICLPESSTSIADVKTAGFGLITDAATAAKMADIAVFMVPDTVQGALYSEIKHNLPLNSTILFAHGFSVHYKLIKPRDDLDVVLVAPMAHGNAVRNNFLDGTSLPVLVAVAQNITGRAWETAKSFAMAIGSSKEMMFSSTFMEETETDLFNEQALICGGLWSLITSAFETLVEAGYSKEVAYFCCLKETQIMADMFGRFGILGTFERISDIAKFGALSRGPRVIDKHVKDEMKKVLDEIQSGKFIEELNEKSGGTNAMMAQLKEHALEILHKKFKK